MYHLFPKLLERTNQLAGSAFRRRAADVRGGAVVMGCPKLLILDEPSIGLAPILIVKVFEIIADINKKGVTHPVGGAERAESPLPGRQSV